MIVEVKCVKCNNMFKFDCSVKWVNGKPCCKKCYVKKEITVETKTLPNDLFNELHSSEL